MKYRVKEYLQAQGMTSKALADKLGMTATGLSLAITGENFTMPRLEQIANIFNCKVSDLLDESTTEESTRPAGIRCPHCGKVLYLATRPEEEPRQAETEPARSPEPVKAPTPPREASKEDGPQLSIFED